MCVAFGVAAFLMLLYCGTLAGLGVWTYRRLHLPTVPWLVASLLLRLVLATLSPQFTSRFMHSGWQRFAESGLTMGEVHAIWGYISLSLGVLGDAMVAWFVIAEFAHVLSKISGAANIRVPAFTLYPRKHTCVLGCVLVILTALPTLLIALASSV